MGLWTLYIMYFTEANVPDYGCSEMMGAYTEDTSGGKLFYSFRVDDKGVAHLPSSKEQLDYEKPFKITP